MHHLTSWKLSISINVTSSWFIHVRCFIHIDNCVSRKKIVTRTNCGRGARGGMATRKFPTVNLNFSSHRCVVFRHYLWVNSISITVPTRRESIARPIGKFLIKFLPWKLNRAAENQIANPFASPYRIFSPAKVHCPSLRGAVSCCKLGLNGVRSRNQNS